MVQQVLTRNHQSLLIVVGLQHAQDKFSDFTKFTGIVCRILQENTNSCKIEHSKNSEYDQEVPHSQPQTNPWHREEEPHNNHETPGRQTKQTCPKAATEKEYQKLVLKIDYR